LLSIYEARSTSVLYMAPVSFINLYASKVDCL
jgi:hypothetical protein